MANVGILIGGFYFGVYIFVAIVGGIFIYKTDKMSKEIAGSNIQIIIGFTISIICTYVAVYALAKLFEPENFEHFTPLFYWAGAHLLTPVVIGLVSLGRPKFSMGAFIASVSHPLLAMSFLMFSSR